MKLKLFDRVKFSGTIRLFENLVDIELEVVVELLEEILKQQREQLTGTVTKTTQFSKTVPALLISATHSSSRLFPT
jgi:hypothetical protein